MKHQQCVNCIFSNWYNNFQEITFRSKVIKLPIEFIEYLKSDGIVLPDEEEIRYSNDLDGYSDTDDDDERWDDEVTTPRAPMFPALKAQVEVTIEELGGSVFPKLNWSSPKDAAWISHNGSLKCTSFNEICLLLKSSDFITHDLNNAYEKCEDSINTSCPNDQFELVLRQWCEVTPGMEFRCFVKQKKLIRISQRHPFYFHYLQEKKLSIFREILNLYNSKIKGRFADSDFVFDIYIDDSVTYVVDFNPFGSVTDPILLEWDELDQIIPQDIDPNNEDIFVIMVKDNGIQPSQFMSYAMPKDMIDLSHGEDVNKMIDFLNLKDLVCRPGDNNDDPE